MQTEVYPNGDVINRFIQARNEEDLQQRLKDEYQRARDAGAISVQQAVLDPENLCPCGSKRKTKNCCLKRYRSIMANAGLPVPTID